MKVRFLQAAQREVDDAVAWYRLHSGRLAEDFLGELDRAVRRALAFPFSCPVVEPGLRRCLLARFPYGLIYGIDKETVVILAVALSFPKIHPGGKRDGLRLGKSRENCWKLAVEVVRHVSRRCDLG